MLRFIYGRMRLELRHSNENKNTHMSQILQSQHRSSLGSVCLSFSILEYSSARVFVLFFLNHQTGFHEVSLCMKNCSLQMNVSNLTYQRGAIFILL